MAKTISQLPDATTVGGSDELIIQQSGVTKRATKTEVLAGIVNANVDAAAAIAGTKIAPNFGSQNVATTGTVAAADFRVVGTKTTALINYLGTQTIVTPDVNDWRTSIRIGSASHTAPNIIEFWANNGQRALIDATGNVGIGTTTMSQKLNVDGSIHLTGSGFKYFSTASEHLALVKKSGPYHFYFRATDDGTAGGANQREMFVIKDTGQVRFVPLAADPAGAEAGDVYYNSGDNKLKVYNGSSWVDLH